MFRVKGVSWWPEEMPSDEEYEPDHLTDFLEMI